MPARSRRYTRRAPPECPRPRSIQVLYWHTQYNMRGKRMQAVFPIYLLNSTVSFLSVISCVRRGRLFHRAGGEAIRFTARAAVSSAGAGLRGPPNGTRAGPAAAVPPAAAGPVRRTRRDAYLPVTAPYIYRRAKRPKSCTYFSFFQKIFCTVGRGDETRKKTCSAPGKLERRTAWDGDKIFRAVGNGDEPGEETRGGTLGGLAETGRSARRHGGEKRGTRGAGPARSETRSARVPRDGKRPAERGGSGRRDVGRVRRVSARRTRKGAKKRRLAPALFVGSFAPPPCRSPP